MEFIDSIVRPYIYILSIGEDEYRLSQDYMRRDMFKPSDALHMGVMRKNGISTIVSEDRE
ncbi:MAG: PIN domain-containing protein [Candidatus Nitrosocaldus sp.]|nr:PIN domain-containing protein [Candidatus Nitrosocaldus sp.]